MIIYALDFPNGFRDKIKAGRSPLLQNGRVVVVDIIQAGSEVSASFKLSDSVEVTVFFITTEDLTSSEVEKDIEARLAETGLDRNQLEEARY